MTGRLWRMMTPSAMIVVFVVVSLVAATLVAVNAPSGQRTGAGVLPPGSQGSLSHMRAPSSRPHSAASDHPALLSSVSTQDVLSWVQAE